jgi:hypothetical protein
LSGVRNRRAVTQTVSLDSCMMIVQKSLFAAQKSFFDNSKVRLHCKFKTREKRLRLGGAYALRPHRNVTDPGSNRDTIPSETSHHLDVPDSGSLEMDPQNLLYIKVVLGSQESLDQGAEGLPRMPPCSLSPANGRSTSSTGQTSAHHIVSALFPADPPFLGNLLPVSDLVHAVGDPSRVSRKGESPACRAAGRGGNSHRQNR